jgi:hypothetical protein
MKMKIPAVVAKAFDSALGDLVRAAVKEEREECAKLLEGWDFSASDGLDLEDILAELARRIRARGDQ